MNRCAWATNHPIYIKYHDTEWGVPVFNDRTQFEFIILEGAQAGLSWLTVLKKRPYYRQVFSRFDPKRVAKYDKQKIKLLLQDAGIIRNRLKVESTVSNAKCFLEVQKEFGSFSKYIWKFVGGKPIMNKWQSIKELPVKTKESDGLSLDLKKRGFRFVGSTIIYAHMQATGMVNDHTTDCFRYREVMEIQNQSKKQLVRA
jgi:DNA-3-methyladenine glycosylase I